MLWDIFLINNHRILTTTISCLTSYIYVCFSLPQVIIPLLHPRLFLPDTIRSLVDMCKLCKLVLPYFIINVRTSNFLQILAFFILFNIFPLVHLKHSHFSYTHFYLLYFWSKITWIDQVKLSFSEIMYLVDTYPIEVFCRFLWNLLTLITEQEFSIC